MQAVMCFLTDLQLTSNTTLTRPSIFQAIQQRQISKTIAQSHCKQQNRLGQSTQRTTGEKKPPELLDQQQKKFAQKLFATFNITPGTITTSNNSPKHSRNPRNFKVSCVLLLVNFSSSQQNKAHPHPSPQQQPRSKPHPCLPTRHSAGAAGKLGLRLRTTTNFNMPTDYRDDCCLAKKAD